jgi:pantetheine-phosphate adenylyltransferase
VSVHRGRLTRALILFMLMPMFKVVFPGSFDPPTLGHMNIIERASLLFDELVVIIAENRQKRYCFSADERLKMMVELIKPWKNVSALIWDSLIADYMKREGVRTLIRGVRGMEDFSYEFELSMMNKGLYPQIETLFMTTEPKYIVLRSSSIRELASFHGDVSAMVPPLVAEALKAKFW